MAIYDAEEGGEMVLWSAISDPKVIGQADAFSVPVGMFDIRFVESR